MIVKKKTLGIGAAAFAAVAALVFVLVPLWGMQTQTTLGENQSYVYAYVSEIRGNELTYTELEESVVTAYLEQQEATEKTEAEEDGISADGSGDKGMESTKEWQNDGEMPDRPDGEAPSGEAPNGEAPNGETPSGEALGGGMPDGESPSGERQSGEFRRRNTETTTTLIPVGVTVHTQSDTKTTFRRLASGDIIKLLMETSEDGEEVITEIWML